MAEDRGPPQFKGFREKINTNMNKLITLTLKLTAVSLLCGLFTRETVRAAEFQFTDDDWASASTASIPVYHNLGIDVVVSDGQGNIYIAGSFSAIGDLAVTNIAKWDGADWSPLGSGIHGRIVDLAIVGDELHAAVSYFDSSSVWVGKDILYYRKIRLDFP